MFLLFLIFPPFNGSAQTDSLRQRIERIAGTVHGQVGVSIIHLETGDTLMVNGRGHFPMQSVYKFPLALSILQQVDSGKLSLGRKIHLTKADLHPDTWSPLREKYPDGNVDISLDELLEYTVSQSDNNGCDVLFSLLGGPSAVERFVRSLGITGMYIRATEEEMHRDWQVQYTNWSTPEAMGKLFSLFYRGNIISATMREYLWQIMASSPTGPNRLRGMLPHGTIVAHKTGSSGTDERGVTAAANDAGIVSLPGNQHVVIVVFISDATGDEGVLDAAIAGIAKAVRDSYPVKKTGD